METKKRIYLGLLVVSIIMIIGLAGLVWRLINNRDFVTNLVMVTITVVAGIILLLLLAGIISIVIIIIRSRTIPSLENITRIANDILFPLTLFTGKIMGIPKEKILSSYIAVNNFLVTARKLSFPGNRILILVPHCLQDAECPHKITINVSNCKQCRKCSVGDLIDLAKKYNATLKVATGGTLARKYIEQQRPRGVIAVACERDLSAGIQDAGLLPIIGVLNCRPNGPCFNTSVNLEKVEAALQTMCKGG